MADLKARGYTFGNPLEAWLVYRVQAGVEQLANLHASTWSSTVGDFPWAGETDSIRDAILDLMAPEQWDAQFAGDAKPPVPDYMMNRERMIAAGKTHWRLRDSKLNYLLHGDAHIANTFISPTGEPGFLDWQAIHVRSAMHDVSYFITSSLTVEDHRKHEKELLQNYLSVLHRAGAPKFQMEEVWGEYRRHVLYGFVWSHAGPMMQPREFVDAMTERYRTAIVGHESLELVEGLEK